MPTIDFTMTLSRDNKAFQATMTPSTDMMRSDTAQSSMWCCILICFIGPSKAGVSFDHMIPREPELRGRRNQPIRVINSENINRILDKLSTQHRVITPDFNMFKARYRKDQKLPAFMENLNNRMAITGLSFEMLRANNALDYEESEAPFSSFGGKRSFNVGLSRKTPGLVTVSGSEFKTYSPTCTILV